MIRKETLYALGDVTIIPAEISDIRHRAECNVYYNIPKYDNDMGGMKRSLPIFASPMASVVNKANFDIWAKNDIIPILPRTEKLEERIEYAKAGKWAAFGLEEFEHEFCIDLPNIVFTHKTVYRALIDIANGHISHLQEIIKKAKKVAEDSNYTIEIMAGNVANPETYRQLAEAGADYVRCSVGTGSVCFVDGTEITLVDGTKKKIEDINIGDKVKTHNSEKTVLNVIRFDTDKELVTINNEITCTSEHKFYVINKSDKNLVTDDNLSEYAYWIEAKKLDKNKHLLIKKY